MNIIFHLDKPIKNQILQIPLFTIQGWIAYKSKYKINNVNLINSEGKVLIPLLIQERPDVKKQYPKLTATGFYSNVKFSESLLSKNYFIEFSIGKKAKRFEIELPNLENIRIKFYEKKQNKLENIKSILKCPLCDSNKLDYTKDYIYCKSCNAQYDSSIKNYNFLHHKLKERENIVEIDDNISLEENISSHAYDEKAINFIEKYKDGLILDNGAGLRNIYYDNVINFEIEDYITTDVRGIGEKLPFLSSSFDAVFSLSVIEHVTNPIEYVKEIERVLKPNGEIYIVAPFLQPFHAYPNHYYNMTSEGLKHLFSKNIKISEINVPKSGLPIWLLSWFLNAYIDGLPNKEAEYFKTLKVSDLIDSPLSYLDKDFVTKLSSFATKQLACSNQLVGTKINDTH
ncbi:MAG: class I SAM-dependent methyltransferase [Bacteroidota bacterium]|nr:class I SAM-dependent methyltransferase [Bacteroidota bacterium]